jgi:hypothetical protein
VNPILAFIDAHMDYLWEGDRYSVVGSQSRSSNGGDALLVVESPTLRLRFVRDRGQLLLDFQPAAEHRDEWWSVDLVRRLLLGRPEPSAVLDESYAAFLGEHLTEVEARFGAERWPATRDELKKLKVRRSKEMWG